MNDHQPVSILSRRPGPWVVAISPLVALGAVFGRAIGMKGGRFAWADVPVMWLTIIALVVGIAGGIHLAITRRNGWWLLAVVAGVVMVYIEIQAIMVSGMAHMH